MQLLKKLKKNGIWIVLGTILTTTAIITAIPIKACALSSKPTKPNILVIWGDDIGYWNVSYNNRGMMDYKTPHIDRLAKEGMTFTDYYAEQSCTAGRAAFITGQHPVRTGLTKVGMPGADLGLRAKDPTLAELLKPHGYITGQFGKNHLGDKDEFLPTNHGFDEFFGNLYHLNAEEEPENPDYPKNPEFHKKFGPRGVIKSSANGKIEDTGPLTKKRMETVDDEFMAGAKNFIKKANKAGKPFFVWFNSTRMHFYTHIRPEHQGISGQNFYADGMVEHDMQVGELLKLLDDLKIADNTIVMYSTDNGPHYNEWPDGGVAPFRGEKNTNWEGGYRVPAVVRWPGKIPGNAISNEIMSHQDWVPTLMAAVGDADIKEKLKKGHKAGKKTFKVHLDGYNFLPHLTGKEKEGPRKEFFYFNDDGQLVCFRYQDWKMVFGEQRARTFEVWSNPFVFLRVPRVFHLRRDPFERANTDSNNYNRWWIKRVFTLVPTQHFVGKFLKSFKEFPPRQAPAKFNVAEVMKLLQEAHSGK
jgi:arylsulfatase